MVRTGAWKRAKNSNFGLLLILGSFVFLIFFFTSPFHAQGQGACSNPVAANPVNPRVANLAVASAINTLRYPGGELADTCQLPNYEPTMWKGENSLKNGDRAPDHILGFFVRPVTREPISGIGNSFFIVLPPYTVTNIVLAAKP